MKINILIEQLILDGLPLEQRANATAQTAVESELTQLIEQNELGSALQSSGSLPSAPPIENDIDPKSLKQQIARPVNKSSDQA